MHKTALNLKGWLDEVLPRVAKPARYAGGELNSVRKPPEEVSVRMALAFPDVYEVGMSNLGLRILYHILNAQRGVAAERAFAPAEDMAALMREASIPLFSLESSLPVRDFDILGFSLAYELTYTTVLDMLNLAGIPVFARDRGDGNPIVVAGGHCAVNPEPMSEFIDAFAIGDGEDVVLDIVAAYEANRADRDRVLAALAEVPGVYVPSVDGRMEPRPRISSRVVSDLENALFPDRLVVPFTETVHDRVMVEIMRGCSRGCRFCQAGMITRPVRERSPRKLIEQANTLLDNTGYEEIALTSLSSADYSHIGDLVRALIDEHGDAGVGISLPSLRADAECVELAAEIQRVRKSGMTFAPEAGTQRLRDVINKNVSDEDLLSAVEAAVDAGWRRVKLYFMIGLPTETDDDLRGIADLVRRVSDVARRRGRPIALSLTISPFVPKPHTPFQWRAMDSPDELERKIALLRSILPTKGIALSWHDPKSSRVEAALARGDARLGQVIYSVWRDGGRLEQDRFDSARWQGAFEQAGLEISDFANRERPKGTPLPWSHIDVGVSSEFLVSEDEKASLCSTTPDCRGGICANCGIRAHLHKLIGTPVVCPPPTPIAAATCVEIDNRQSTIGNPKRVLFTFTKNSDARWLGHLDLQRVFERAVKMSHIGIAYSQGFNPRPKLSIASALPLGATAGRELLTLQIIPPFDVTAVTIGLNRCLPDGVRLVEARVLSDNDKGPVIIGSEFALDVALPDGASVEDVRRAANELLSRESLPFERISSKERKRIDLRPGIDTLEVEPGASADHALVTARLPHLSYTVKPSEVVSALSQIVPDLRSAGMHRKRLITGDS